MNKNKKLEAHPSSEKSSTFYFGSRSKAGSIIYVAFHVLCNCEHNYELIAWRNSDSCLSLSRSLHAAIASLWGQVRSERGGGGAARSSAVLVLFFLVF
jgi:hypothetical protein